MDRYIVREPRNEPGYATPHQIIAYQQNGVMNNPMPEPVYYGGEFAVARAGGAAGRFMQPVHGSSPYPPVGMTVAMPHNPAHMVSGIDPTYLSSYAGLNTPHFNNGEAPAYRPREEASLGNPVFVQQPVPPQMSVELTHQEILSKSKQLQRIPPANETVYRQRVNINEAKPSRPANAAAPTEQAQNTEQSPAKNRGEVLKRLHKGGPRALAGSVDNVLKWHKALADTGLLVIYEVVAKCVSVRPGESSSVQLVLRDAAGPAMQALYYQIDYLLPDLAPPCTVRVVGRMMGGSNRLHAFCVRLASGDDSAALPRRAAAATHHVTKICNEFRGVPA